MAQSYFKAKHYHPLNLAPFPPEPGYSVTEIFSHASDSGGTRQGQMPALNGGGGGFHGEWGNKWGPLNWGIYPVRFHRTNQTLYCVSPDSRTFFPTPNPLHIKAKSKCA